MFKKKIDDQAFIKAGDPLQRDFVSQVIGGETEQILNNDIDKLQSKWNHHRVKLEIETFPEEIKTE